MPTQIYIYVQKHCWTWKCPKWPDDDKNNSLSTWKFHNVKFFSGNVLAYYYYCCVSQHNWMKFQTERLLCLGCPEFSTQLSLTKGDAREAATSQRIRSAAAGQLPNSSPSTIEQLSWEFAQEKNPNWRSRHGRLCGVRLKRLQASQFDRQPFLIERIPCYQSCYFFIF